MHDSLSTFTSGYSSAKIIEIVQDMTTITVRWSGPLVIHRSRPSTVSCILLLSSGGFTAPVNPN